MPSLSVSAGGPVDYLVEAFGNGTISGGLNLTLWLGYVLALALYTRVITGQRAPNAGE